MTLGSLFDGVGGWQLAARRAGIVPLWSSEIDEFCMSVTRRHFPDTTQLGDINGIVDAPHVDIITAGSPCQDLSIAGKRSGINGERSGLFFRAVELVRRIRPEFFVWENVPGVLSVNGGKDFAAILAEIAASDIPVPECGFANAGVVDFHGGQLAYRILDAQYFGVPQRRRRIFLVADFAGRRAAQILFEPASVSRDPASRESSQQSTAARIGSRADCAVYDNHGQDCRITRLGDVAPTVSAKYGTGGNNTPLVSIGFNAWSSNPWAGYELTPPPAYLQRNRCLLWSQPNNTSVYRKKSLRHWQSNTKLAWRLLRNRTRRFQSRRQCEIQPDNRTRTSTPSRRVVPPPVPRRLSSGGSHPWNANVFKACPTILLRAAPTQNATRHSATVWLNPAPTLS